MTRLRNLASAALVAALIAGPHVARAQHREVLAAANGVEIAAGYATAAGPTAPTAAAYMLITNASGAPDRLIGVEGDAARRIELHMHSLEDGVARMREVEGGIALPPGETVALERGGLHVMLMGLTGPLEERAAVDLTLVFEAAGRIPVSLPVRSDGAPAGDAHQH
jgi:periplasmic copper chaperone A